MDIFICEEVCVVISMKLMDSCVVASSAEVARSCQYLKPHLSDCSLQASVHGHGCADMLCMFYRRPDRSIRSHCL